jgi:hypothetical protein
MLRTEMHIINKKNNKNGSIYFIAASTALATVFTFAIMVAASNIAIITPAEATTTATTGNTTTNATTSSSGIELSPEPVYQELSRTESENPINETHVQLTISGNGTLTLPNGTETINTTSTGNLITSMDGIAIGNEVITTEDGGENATAKIFGIARFNMEEEGSGRAILISLLNTNSTGSLAPLDGTILAALGEINPDGTQLLTWWEWQSGIPLPTTAAAATTTNTTTTDTNTTATP